jgi:hypothetical protein
VADETAGDVNALVGMAINRRAIPARRIEAARFAVLSDMLAASPVLSECLA